MTRDVSPINDSFCDLCGLPLRYGTFTSDSSGKTFRFCCMGCKQVFHMLMEASDNPDPASFRQTELFKTCLEMGIIPVSENDLAKRQKTQAPLAPTQPMHDHLEETEGLRTDPDERILSLNLTVSDMWCPACAWVIEETLKKRSGILNATCNFATDRVRLDYDPVLTSPSQIVGRIRGLGYRASIPGQETGSTERKQELIRFGISAFLTMNVMMLSFALYSGFFTELSRDTIFKLSWPIFVMASVVLFYGGRHIYQRALAGITSAGFSMETLITVGSFSAFIYSTFNLFSGSIELYYDTASMLITLFLMGKAIERKTKDEVQGDLGNFFSLRPKKVRICSELYPEGRYVSAEQLQEGDRFRVDENEVIPADGIILSGEGLVDESSLTGEPLPVAKKPGHRLKSGTRVTQGVFKVKGEAVGENSTLGQMIRITEKALGSKMRLEGKTDLALQWFVPIILVLASGTGLVSLLFGLSPGEAVIRAVTVMVISCPCALGVAIPLARVAGISLAGKKGLLVHDFSAFEQAERIDAFVFDKTGTITKGQWALIQIIPLGPFTEEQILGLAASLEQTSEHYIGMEIKKRAEEGAIPPVELRDIKIFENGISGQTGNGVAKIGSRGFLSKELEMADVTVTKGLFGEDSAEISLIFMSNEDKPCAVLAFGDKIKASASTTAQALRAMGYRLALVSGDSDRTTKAIGHKTGIEPSYGGKLPQDKAAFIMALQNEGHHVAMVGDGINDAPALVQAELSMAVHSGSHLGKEAADVTLMRGDPQQILEFLALAKRVNRKIRHNLFFSFFYNALSIPIAMSGLLTPIVAVCAMLMSSLSVIGNTLMLIKKAN